MPQTFDTLRIRNVIGFRSDQVYLWPPVATAPTGSCCKAWRGLRPTLAAGTDPELCGRDNTGQSAVSCSERQGGLGSPLEILACRVGPHPLPTERSPCGAQMAAEWPAARGASVQREGRSPCSRRLGAAPRSPSSVTGGEKAPRAPPALLLARGTGPGPTTQPAELLCASNRAPSGPPAHVCATRGWYWRNAKNSPDRDSKAPIDSARAATAASRAPAPARPGGASKKGKGNGEGFFFFPSVFISKNMNCQARLPARRVRGSCRLPGRHAAGSCHHCPGSESLLIQPGTVLLLRVTEMHDGHTHGRMAS